MLPDGVVRVLDGERRQRIGAARPERLVQSRQLTPQDAAGPLVEDDVVHRQGEDVFVRGHADQGGAHQGAYRQVERCLRLPGDQQPDRGGRVGETGHVDQRQGVRCRRRVDDLVGHPVRSRHQTGAQHLVACRHRVQGRAQCRDVRDSVQTQGQRQVVVGGSGLQLVEEPQPLLPEGQRQRAVPSGLADRCQERAPGRSVDRRGECPYGRVVEQCRHGHVGAEHLTDAGHHLGGQQGVSAQFEEVVLGAHAVRAEELCPDAA